MTSMPGNSTSPTASPVAARSEQNQSMRVRRRRQVALPRRRVSRARRPAIAGSRLRAAARDTGRRTAARRPRDVTSARCATAIQNAATPTAGVARQGTARRSRPSARRRCRSTRRRAPAPRVRRRASTPASAVEGLVDEPVQRQHRERNASGHQQLDVRTVRDRSTGQNANRIARDGRRAGSLRQAPREQPGAEKGRANANSSAVLCAAYGLCVEQPGGTCRRRRRAMFASE